MILLVLTLIAIFLIWRSSQVYSLVYDQEIIQLKRTGETQEIPLDAVNKLGWDKTERIRIFGKSYYKFFITFNSKMEDLDYVSFWVSNPDQLRDFKLTLLKCNPKAELPS